MYKQYFHASRPNRAEGFEQMDKSWEFDEPTRTSERFAGYDRIMGNISWLLIALVSLDIKLLPSDRTSSFYLTALCIALLLYNIVARYWFMAKNHSPFKIFVDLMVFLAFIVTVSWFTGRLTSPFISLIYLILMATSLTQGRRITYFMAVLAVSSYILLASEFFSDPNNLLYQLLQIFPFMLIAHLGAMLAGETESARQEVERLSLTDELTGLNNMRNFFQLTIIQDKLADRYGKHYTICMIDADNLKQINDKNGHLAGTELIKHTARIIERNIRCTDIPARYGGDEFVIMFTESTKEESAIAVERILRQLAETPFDFDGRQLFSTLSAGIASFPEDGDTVRTVMAKADQALYASKKKGKNQLTIA